MAVGFNLSRRFGVELEVVLKEPDDDPETVADTIGREAGVHLFSESIAEYYHNDNIEDRRWHAKSDSSIEEPGFEIVSPALAGETGLLEVQDVIGTLGNYCKSHRSCGLHVHHEARDLSNKQFVNVYKTYYSLQAVIAFLMPPSRRCNSYCPPLDMTIGSWGKTPAEQREAVMRGDRYSVNLASFQTRGTIEFRQHQSTTDPNYILAWLFLTQRILEYAKEVKNPKETREIKLSGMFRRLGWGGSSLLDSRTRWTRAFWEERFARFTNGAQVVPLKIGGPVSTNRSPGLRWASPHSEW